MLAMKYRPQSWDDFAGNAKAVQRVRAAIGRPGFGATGIWISGKSGIGKTSLAWLIARELGAGEVDVEEIDGDSCLVDRVRELDRSLRPRPMFGSAKVVICNEAHAISNRAVQAWLTLLERLPQHAVIIFTTTEKSEADLFGDFTNPFLSRCLHVELWSHEAMGAFAKRAQWIAQQEGLDGKPLARYQQLVEACKGNLRQALSKIEMGEMSF